jgi:hypothetical protein
MSLQTWQETLISSQVDGTAITNTTTQASLIPAAAKYTLPANFFSTIGKVLKFSSHGRISNVVTTPGTLLFQVLFGATAVFNNGAAAGALNIVAKTDVAYWMEIVLTCRAIGTSANLMGQCQFTSESVVGAAAGAASSFMIPLSAPAVGSNFDSTLSQVVDLQAKFSVATATTSIQSHQYKLESLM